MRIHSVLVLEGGGNGAEELEIHLQTNDGTTIAILNFKYHSYNRYCLNIVGTCLFLFN